MYSDVNRGGNYATGWDTIFHNDLLLVDNSRGDVLYRVSSYIGILNVAQSER